MILKKCRLFAKITGEVERLAVKLGIDVASVI
jgi:hypothetical protein